jgi:Uncharacterised protein family (UPF0158)
MFTLPNGKPVDREMIELAMEDGNLEHSYYLNIHTGEVTFLSAFINTAEEIEQQVEGIETSDEYVPIERLPSSEAYQWMEQFVAEIVAPKDALAAETLSIALMGKGAFRRFKDVLHRLGEEWVQAWYRWRSDQFTHAMREWLADLPVKITEA